MRILGEQVEKIIRVEEEHEAMKAEMEEREAEDGPQPEVDENAMSINFWEICKFETKEESGEEMLILKTEEDDIAAAEKKFK